MKFIIVTIIVLVLIITLSALNAAGKIDNYYKMK